MWSLSPPTASTVTSALTNACATGAGAAQGQRASLLCRLYITRVQGLKSGRLVQGQGASLLRGPLLRCRRQIVPRSGAGACLRAAGARWGFKLVDVWHNRFQRYVLRHLLRALNPWHQDHALQAPALQRRRNGRLGFWASP